MQIRKLIFLISILVFANPILGQHKHRNKLMQKITTPFFIETHLFPQDSLYKCYFSYRIPFNNMLFVKNGNDFSSGITIDFEIKDSNNITKRFFTSNSILTSVYEETISENKYLQGVTSVELKKGKFFISPKIHLTNTDIEFALPAINIIADSNIIMKPFIIAPSSNNDSSFAIVNNFQNSIPFTKSPVKMLIPIYDDKVSEINITIKQNKKVVFTGVSAKTISMSDKLKFNDGNIILMQGDNLRYFIVENFNKNLIEGMANVKINNKIDFPLQVFWREKPKSLMNIENAINALRYIGLDNIADSLEDVPEPEAYKALFNYWSKYDDDPTDKFNDVFFEFYSRIDFINKNFNSLGKHDALNTDRGKIYLVYGKPSKVERKYSDVYNIIEVWTYNSINEKIYFSDKSGTGKFVRIK